MIQRNNSNHETAERPRMQNKEGETGIAHKTLVIEKNEAVKLRLVANWQQTGDIVSFVVVSQHLL